MGGFVDSIFGGPDAPDPYATAEAQSAANLEALKTSAGINQMGVNMPGYNINYTGDIGDPNRTMNYELSGPQAELSRLLSGGAASAAGNLPSFSGVPALPGVGDFAGEGQRVEDMTFDAMMSRLRPEQQRSQEQLLTQLNVSGNPLGSEGYNTEMDRMSQQTSDQNLQAALASMMAGKGEQSRQFGLGLAGHQQGVADIGAQTSNLANLMSMDPATQAQAPSQPNYQLAPPDIAGLIQGNYQTQAGNQQAMLGGLAGLGGAAMMAPVGTFGSDKRFKHNITRIGSLPSGIPIYDFSYLGSDIRHTGVMAQEVLPIIPEAVIMDSDGYYSVDYGAIH